MSRTRIRAVKESLACVHVSSVVLRKVDAFACRGVLFLGLLLMGTMSEAQSAQIYFSETPAGRIGRANLDGTGKVTLLSGLPLPVGPALDLAGGQMYWGEMSSRTMKRANLDGTGQTIVISAPNGGLPALDLSGGRMYWSVSGDGTLRSANLDGSGQQVLITGQNDPHAPVLDLVGGKIYWANFGVGDVRRANLDGTGQETLASLASSSLLALDVPGGKMYWTVQRANGEIRRANLDGSSQEILVQGQNSPSGIALDIDNGHIYWANNVGGDIRRANLDGGGEEILITGLSGLAVIALDLSVLAPFPPRPSITQFTPASGPPGTAVTILGANLGEDAAVRFNGIPTTVLSLGANEVVAVVPETATSGPISLATPGGTTMSLASFTVTAAATQSSFMLQAGGAASSGTIGPYGSLRAGYASVAVDSGGAPWGTAVFSYTQSTSWSQVCPRASRVCSRSRLPRTSPP